MGRRNWRPTKVAFLDFETQSRAPLDTATKYAKDPSTCVLTCCIEVDGQMHRMGPYLTAEDKELLAKVAETHTLVAHNSPFDEAVWEHTLGLPEATWFDTLPCCRAGALPGKLEEACQTLFGEGKDPMGRKLIDMLCILKGPAPSVGPAHQLLLQYNERDVVVLRKLYERVKGYVEPDVMTVDSTVNKRGIPIDRSALEALRDLYALNREVMEAEFAANAPDVNPRSQKQVLEWLRRSGFKVPERNGVPHIDKFAYKEFVANPEKYFLGDDDSDMQAAFDAVYSAMEARREVVRVGASKADAALAGLEPDGRVRDQFVYWGAHTGRWSGRLIQFHNMPVSRDADVLGVPLTYDAAKACAEAATAKVGRKVLVADVLNAMLRHIVSSDNLLVADYGAVEARGTAWVAGEERMLELYRDPTKSVYLDMGRQVFGRPISKKEDQQEYNMAKTLVLGCSYGMSGAKFAFTCKSRGISTEVFESAGLDTAEAVKVYRATYPRIPAVWKEFGDAVLRVVEHNSHARVGRCDFYMDGSDMVCRLPSGRCLRYRQARIELKVPAYVKFLGMPDRFVQTVVFDLPRNRQGYLYGSRIVENVVQAICRDLLACTLVECEKAGLRPVMHVHDEVVLEAPPEKLREFLSIMSSPPAWASGFPILAEGYSGPVWTKGGIKGVPGFAACDAMDGRVL